MRANKTLQPRYFRAVNAIPKTKSHEAYVSHQQLAFSVAQTALYNLKSLILTEELMVLTLCFYKSKNRNLTFCHHFWLFYRQLFTNNVFLKKYHLKEKHGSKVFIHLESNRYSVICCVHL
jgi:hypothetical protein